ncbi:hypothetical protein EV144_107142 [Flavobacterium sp. 270]|uniref:hypothetical protein n=1 Tax=Flavobacterium sp. 270 TaxID=2512114 RepID=UPI00106649AB|nr:hypothetical protein [Flavobacterium sp. 270]TDW45950.1 hypothetical protein EV144_107142 [Flavobacterium sp. 270]
MELNFHEQIKSIEKCPLDNHEGEKTLFRCVENPISTNSFIPQAVLLKPKFQDYCIAWGLSVFTNYEHANQILNNLSKSKKVKYSAIAKSTITDEDGIKHCLTDKNHYTFFPKKDLDLLTKFTIVNED